MDPESIIREASVAVGAFGWVLSYSVLVLYDCEGVAGENKIEGFKNNNREMDGVGVRFARHVLRDWLRPDRSRRLILAQLCRGTIHCY